MSKDRITIADVAEKAQVSKMTVSRVINKKGEISEATRQKVLIAMEELGYRPNSIARSLVTNTTLRIGITVPSLANPYFGTIIEGAERFFWESNYQILLGHTDGEAKHEQAVMDIFEDHRVDGIIVLSGRSSSEEMTHYLSRQRAAVGVNTEVDSKVAARIFTDERASMNQAVQHLIKGGRQHLAYVGINVSTYAADNRYLSFKVALQNAGYTFDKEQQSRDVFSDEDDVVVLVSDMLRKNPKIDGLICFNIGIAARALQACELLNLTVPDDVAVIGYDDTLLAQLTNPPLTTLDLTIPKRDLGAMAARMLLERIENSEIQQEDVILQHKLVVRASAP